MKRIYAIAIIALAVSALFLLFFIERDALNQTHRAQAPAAAATPELPATSTIETPATADGKGGYPYIDVVDSCGPYYQGTCVNMRSGPGTDYPIVMKLRRGVVLKVAGSVERDGRTWLKLDPGEDIRYPERVTSDWYVAADTVELFYDDGIHTTSVGEHASTTKRIDVNLSSQTLVAYDGDSIFMRERISTGLDLTPTPRGTFTVFRMTPSRYMQGPIPEVSDQYYDLPGVPWNLYFTAEGAVIHGAYWHDHFGEPWSHGCINLPPEKAKELYLWAVPGMTVTVHD